MICFQTCQIKTIYQINRVNTYKFVSFQKNTLKFCDGEGGNKSNEKNFAIKKELWK